MPVITALQFLGACLVLGLGVFLASEAFARLRQHLAPRAFGHAMAVLGGLITAGAGGYWAAAVVPW